MKQVIVRVQDDKGNGKYKTKAKFYYYNYLSYESRVFHEVNDSIRNGQSIYIKVGNQWSRTIDWQDIIDRMHEDPEYFTTFEDALHYELLCYDVRTTIRNYLPRF